MIFFFFKKIDLGFEIKASRKALFFNFNLKQPTV